MRKTLVRLIRELKLLSSSWKNIIFFETFLWPFFMGNPSLRLSEVLSTVNFFNTLLVISTVDCGEFRQGLGSEEIGRRIAVFFYNTLFHGW